MPFCSVLYSVIVCELTIDTIWFRDMQSVIGHESIYFNTAENDKRQNPRQPESLKTDTRI